MKAISFPVRDTVTLTDRPDPVAGPGQVVVEVKASGICHTDYEVLRANYGTGAFPLVPGHEYAGILVDIGTGVTGLSIGDRVAIDPNIECGRCAACARGWAHLCEALRAYGVTEDGGFAAFSAVHAGAVHPIGEMAFGQAALAEPMGCVLNGVDAVHDEHLERALIFGAGPMGLLMAIALAMRGVGEVALVDIDETRLALAENFGFRPLAAGSDDLARLHHGVDLAVDATGVPAVAQSLTGYIANGGKGLYFGVCPESSRIEISPFEVFRRQLTLAGTHSLNHNIPAALATIAEYGPRIAEVVSHRLSLDEVVQVLASKPPAGSLKVQAVRD